MRIRWRWCSPRRSICLDPERTMAEQQFQCGPLWQPSYVVAWCEYYEVGREGTNVANSSRSQRLAKFWRRNSIKEKYAEGKSYYDDKVYADHPLQAMGISGRTTPVAMDGYMIDSAPTPTTMHIDMDPSDKKRGADNAADTMTLASMPQTSSGTGSWQYIQETPGQRFKLSDAAKTQTTSHGVSSSWSIAQSPV